MLKIIFFLVWILLSRLCESYNNIVNDEIKCLNGLQLIELIKIRKSFDKLQCSISDKPESNINFNSYDKNSDELIESRILNDNKITALPLIGSFHRFLNGNKNVDRSFENGNEHHEMWEKTKPPTKLETVFQLSITALSFLAFGGYLLCMIVQAIKSKGTTYFHPVATAATQTNMNNPLKKIKVYRRQRRTIRKLPTSINNITKNQSSLKFLNDPKMALPNPNDMYKILILFAEGYVKLTDI